MTQQVHLLCKPDDPSSNPGTHIKMRENPCHRSDHYPAHTLRPVSPPISTHHTQIIIIIINSSDESEKELYPTYTIRLPTRCPTVTAPSVVHYWSFIACFSLKVAGLLGTC